MRGATDILCLLVGFCLSCAGLAEEELAFAEPLDFDPQNVKVMLYRSNGKSSRIFLDQQGSVEGYDRSWSLKILIHGFSESDQSSWMVNMRNAFLKKGFNVITVDWSFYSAKWDFPKAMNYTVPVGEHVAAIIRWMNDLLRIQNNEHHVIGFSLGSHIAGIIGYNLQNPKLARISGLDVPSPYYANKPLEVRLDQSDAEFVDVIHTNGGTLFDGGLGWTTSVGHVDFYANGGRRQPGCVSYFLALIFERFLFYDSSCHHGRAPLYYIESIDSNEAFRTHACTKETDYQQEKCLHGQRLNRMGFYAMLTSDKEFYLSTRAESPYNANDVFVNVTIQDNQENTAGTITLSVEGDGMTEERTLLDNKSIRGGEVINRVIGISPDMRTITRTTVTFEKRRTSSIGLLKVDTVTLFNALLNKRYCLKSFDVDSEKPETILATEC